MEDVISHERERAFARRAITTADLAKWSGITFESAGRLEDMPVFIPGLTEGESKSLKFRHLAFSDSRSPSEECRRFALSNDGKFLAASFWNSEALVWRLSDGLLVQRLQHQGHTGDVRSLSFSPDNHTLVSGSDDGSAIVWDIRNGRVLLRLEGQGKSVRRVAYAPHGTLIATASTQIGSGNNRSVKIWDTSTGACLHSFSYDEEIETLAFSSDGARLCIELEKHCLLYDIQTYALIATLQHDAGKTLTWSMAHEGDRIATASDGRVAIWSGVTGDKILAIEHPQELSRPVTFSPDGTEVLAGCLADKTAVTFDSRTGQLRHTFQLSDGAYRVAYSPDGEYVVLGDDNDDSGELQIFDAKSGSFLAKLEAEGKLFRVEFVPDSHHLLIDFRYQPLRLCDVQDIMRMR
ncbi:uncharacterized protein PHACADRAFT_249029 [Phanerochaete carnosa HHB-10118-sp]|uniref:Pyrrolo-quinoline quinone repeat domain-containing protein n=1 Tax=Phanerochaete carnosa (strain HHB-10118-sp) TaxID=650164 RepID=K5X7U0_PHACS|nr:uncharacterized protein PHACADRAFT_249029 [Phanerochaete carnosa HHB-10118-sp]EKM58912.1 hypothetical protein PHACADRAFT_249029 [Phanerochaete carnosa HHB-10118-sp]